MGKFGEKRATLGTYLSDEEYVILQFIFTIYFLCLNSCKLKWLGASIPLPSLSSASRASLTLSPLIVICLPCHKDALLSHFAVAGSLSPSTTLSLQKKEE